MSRRRQILLSVILAIAGTALLVWYVRDTGVEELLALLPRVGWGFLAILILSLARLLTRSLAWRALIAGPVPISSTLAATLTGDALGNVTPLNLAVSEPAKVMYIGRHVPAAHALAALAAENFFYSVSVAVYVILGTAAMLTAFELPDRVEHAGIAALVFMAAVLAGAAWLAWQRPSLLSTMLGRLPIPKLASMVDRVRDFETRAYGSVGGQTARLASVVSLHFVFHVLSFAEAWTTVYLLTGSSEPLAALVLDTANRVVNVAFRMVPMRAGVDTFTSGTVALAIGLPEPIGVAASLVRAARVIVWAIVGFALLARRSWR